MCRPDRQLRMRARACVCVCRGHDDMADGGLGLGIGMELMDIELDLDWCAREPGATIHLVYLHSVCSLLAVMRFVGWWYRVGG
ncbi:hypothetical protein BT67DRAFT_88 [Trichocladium antarcticum]|uniref:Uncharacterized protein n=1 Tax=Trichocladium antarcticum TaxID=1450529 RepID=A0AAN6US00_9PEZI|nr:hypothetical protein BT67DRAFT_88 [Trichocladium antarcticum]